MVSVTLMAYIIKLCASDVCVPVCACYHYRYIEMELDWIGLDLIGLDVLIYCCAIATSSIKH